MYANAIEVLDMYENQGRFNCSVERYSVYGNEDAPLTLSWNDTSPRDGFRAVGGGVAFVQVGPDGMSPKPVSAMPDLIGDKEFAWRDTAHVGKMIVLVVLPLGYVVKDLRDIVPSAVRFKVFNGRLAFYWDIGKQITDLRWKIAAKGTRNLDKLCADLNKSALNTQPQEPRIPEAKTTETPPPPQPPQPSHVAQDANGPATWEKSSSRH